VKERFKHPLVSDLAVILALIAIAVVGYRYSPQLLPATEHVIAAGPDCNLNVGPCRTALPDGASATLALTPQPVPVVSPFEVEVRIEGLAVDTLALDFAGTEMNMGFNRISLDDQGGGRWHGTAAIPVCVTGRMNWRATLLIKSGSRQFSVQHDFAAPLGAEAHKH
jgi:hypothetical protein